MSAQIELILAGFGLRLREERKRLGFSQEEFADLAGIKRIAQSQYEREVREPRLSYLAAVGAKGVDIYYLLYGKKYPEVSVSLEKCRDIEKQVFHLVEEYVSGQCGGVLSSEGRYVLFEVLRSHATQAVQHGRSGEQELAFFLPQKNG